VSTTVQSKQARSWFKHASTWSPSANLFLASCSCSVLLRFAIFSATMAMNSILIVRDCVDTRRVSLLTLPSKWRTTHFTSYTTSRTCMSASTTLVCLPFTSWVSAFLRYSSVKFSGALELQCVKKLNLSLMWRCKISMKTQKCRLVCGTNSCGMTDTLTTTGLRARTIHQKEDSHSHQWRSAIQLSTDLTYI
jgi:hypothetical protein